MKKDTVIDAVYLLQSLYVSCEIYFFFSSELKKKKKKSSFSFLPPHSPPLICVFSGSNAVLRHDKGH